MEETVDDVQSRGHQPAKNSVGRRLREERNRQEMSLRELARRIGVSPSLISQIETGRSEPSVRTLYAMVAELNVSLDDLLSDGQGLRAAGYRSDSPETIGAPVEAGRSASPVQPNNSRKAIDLESGVRWERLTAAPDAEVDFLYVIYDVDGASSESEALMRHSGQEYGFVLRGSLGVTIQFENYTLGPGDSISFESTTPHRLWNMGNEPVHAVWFVVGRHNDPRVTPSHDADASTGGW